MTAPCKGCERRHIGCHTICTDYRDWKNLRDAALEKKDMEQKARPEPGRSIMRKFWRAMKKIK